MPSFLRRLVSLNFLRSEATRKKVKIIQYKDPKIIELINELDYYSHDTYMNGGYKVGDIVKFKNHAVGMFRLNDKKRIHPFFMSPKYLEKYIQILKFQRFDHIDWPARSDPKLITKLADIFTDLNYVPEPEPKPGVDMCNMKSQFTYSYYQQTVGTYLVYGPYRGLIVWHGLGSGKTCTSIKMIDHYVNKMKLENQGTIDFNKRIYVVLPSGRSAALEENFRSELAKQCPSFIKDAIGETRDMKYKMDMTNRVINKYMTIVTYIQLKNRVARGAVNLENTLLILDEAHNFVHPKQQYAKVYAKLKEYIRATKNIKLALLTATPISTDLSDLTQLVNVMRHKSDTLLPATEADFKAKYFNGYKLNTSAFNSDLQGYISYYSNEDNVTYFAQKVMMPNLEWRVSDDHYNRWLESFKGEIKSYNVKEEPADVDITKVTSKEFLNPISGYLKKSSAMANYPVMSYRAKDIWPEKFIHLLENIRKYPKDKHFVISRHKASGSNAIGYFLEKNGYTRMSNNSKDHGSNPPKNYNELSTKLYKLDIKLKNKEISEEAYKTAKTELFKKHDSNYKGFVVLNNSTSQKQIEMNRGLFNMPENNNGRYIQVFITDEKFSEGISLFSTLHVHMFEPFYSKQAEDQAIARAVRRCSHKNIPMDKRVVTIHKYFSVAPDVIPPTKQELKRKTLPAPQEGNAQAQAQTKIPLMTDEHIQLYNDFRRMIIDQVIESAQLVSIEAGLLKKSKSKSKYIRFKKMAKIFMK